MSDIYFTGPDSMYEPISHVKMYSDGTPMVKTGGWSRIVAKADTIVVRHHSLQQFVTAMFLVDAVGHQGGLIKRLVLPYVPGARQDRTNPAGDVLFTAYSVGNMIRERFKFSDVVILDPHSQGIVDAMGPRPIIYPLSEVVNEFDKGQYDGVIAPDKGAKSRAQEVADALGLPVFYGGKTRDVTTGKLNGFTLEPLDAEPFYTYNGHYLVVDDICDGGGTFNGLAEKIKEQGATADLYVSHGIFSKGTSALLENYQNIYTTDSLDQGGNEGVTVIPVVNKMEAYDARD